ncbi:MAG: hypothetical protein PHV85_02815 [Desulfovibrionaceae bacterium]|nr:hypothetical protein [Desulfovibrionaceae bacterium]MDD4951462.1 hypothetical protein [Desulfovibrionaceae bacterium]
MSAYSETIRFAREVLGCGCPEEVFGRVECVFEGRLGEPEPRLRRITIGDRLLIHVRQVEGPIQAAALIPDMVRQGLAERNAKGLNRFRAVLLADIEPEAVMAAAQQAFEALSETDDKVHVHVLPSKAVAGI